MAELSRNDVTVLRQVVRWWRQSVSKDILRPKTNRPIMVSPKGTDSIIQLVDLEYTGGSNGGPQDAAAFRYNVRKLGTDEIILANHNIAESPNKVRRPNGTIEIADFGMAIFDKDLNRWLVIYANEVKTFSIC